MILFCSCNRGQKSNFYQEQNSVNEVITYADGLKIEHFSEFSLITLKDPWNEERILHKYVLVPDSISLPSNLPEGTIVRTPINNIVVYTSVHASILEELGEENRIVGVCEPQYLTSETIINMVETGEIVNVGEAANPNIERIIDLKTNVILASPFENVGYGAAEKLGIPIIEGADYMENTPLGRAEWIKFYGLLVGKEKIADSLFRNTVKNYSELKSIVAGVSYRPTVITERKYGVSWSIPGGKSYLAEIIKDAGAEYIFKDNDKKGSTSTSFETVLEKGGDADFWLLKYASDKPFTYSELKAEYQPYEYFSPFKNRKIFACNTIATPYYDEIMLYPEYLLADFIQIFHPELNIQGYKQRYFFPMNR